MELGMDAVREHVVQVRVRRDSGKSTIRNLIIAGGDRSDMSSMSVNIVDAIFAGKVTAQNHAAQSELITKRDMPRVDA